MFEDLPQRVRKHVPRSTKEDIKSVILWLRTKVREYCQVNNPHKLRAMLGRAESPNKLANSFKERVVYLKKWWKKHRPKHLDIHIKITLTRLIIIASLIWAVYPHSKSTVAVDEPKQLKIPKSLHKHSQTKLKPLAVVRAMSQPKPVYRAPVVLAPVSSYHGTGDKYLDWIVEHESGGNAYAVNPSSGACGLAQELPCGKSGCSLGDAVCEIGWMRSYCISRYGSTYNAYRWWLQHSSY